MILPARANAEGREVPLSAVIESVLDEALSRPVRLGDIIDQTADRGYGLMLLVLGLPMLIPLLPPGSSTVVGPIYAAFAVQMISGARRPWVPRRFRNWILTEGTVRTLRQRGLPLIRKAERLSRPRGAVVRQQAVLRAAGVMVLLMGLVLLSPLPFMNTLPALSVMLIGMGLLNHDALFMLAGLAVGGIALGLIGMSAGLLVMMLERMRSTIP